MDLPCAADDRCIRYGISADIPILDPHITESKEAGIVLRQVFDSLVYRDPDTHEIVPGLAAEWQASADGLQYTFNLRTDIRFHDGSAFDAAAVAANIERIYEPELSTSFARELMGPLKQYEILGDYAIRLTLASPFPAFLDSLAQPFLGMSSPDALLNYSDLRHQFHLAGTGPFRLTEYLPGERVILRRFEEYRVDPPIYSQPVGEAIDRVEFVITRGDDPDALTDLDRSLDVIDNVSPAEAQNLASNSRVQVLPTEIPGASFQFLFNTRRDHVSRREVRLALLLATNRAAIVDQVYFNFSPVAWAPLSESTGFSHTGYINRYGLDLDAAQDLLAAAGYSDSDGDGILEHEETPLSLTIVVPPWDGMPAVAAMLQRQWRAIGIDLRIEPVPGATRLRSFIQSGQYDLVPVESYGIDPQLLNNVFLESGYYASARAPEPQLNAILLDLMQQLDPVLRRSQAYAIQALIMDEVLILPVREIVRLTAAQADLVNLRFDAYGFYPLLHNLSIAER
ncbi:MAG: ABC transporter substrate-binding protein [Chloroflexi bacterium]|nr:ABC transporter substrate-binding protein [Chloroflexota bacterium]